MPLERRGEFEGLEERRDSFPPLLKRPKASLVDNSTGLPVLRGIVNSGKVVGSQVWVPTDYTSGDGVRLGIYTTFSGGVSGLFWFRDGRTVSGSEADDPVGSGAANGQIYTIGSGNGLDLVLEAQNDDQSPRSTLQLQGGASGQIDLSLNDGTNTASASLTWLAGTLMSLSGIGRARGLVQGSTVSVTHSAQASKSTAVSFPATFNAAPVAVIATPDTGRSDVVCSTGAISDTGFSLTTRQMNDTAISATFTVRWLALGGDS